MKKSIYIVSIILILFTSCAKEESKNVNQDSIYAIYELFYNSSTDITTAQATFRFGGPTGTLLKLSDSSNVKFQGDELLYHVTGIHKKEYPGFTTNGTFVYTDLDNNIFTNTTGTIDTIAFPAVDTINSTSAYTFQWIGNPIDSNETISLTINGSQQSNAEVFLKLVYGATDMVLEANRLQNLGIGDAACTLRRIHNRADVDEGTTKGGRMSIWYTTKKTIYIQ